MRNGKHSLPAVISGPMRKVLARPILGPADHGRAMTLEAFEACATEQGFRSEIIDGRVYIVPEPNLLHERILVWLHALLYGYTHSHPHVLNFLSQHSRVFVPNRSAATVPEPDFAAYSDFPHQLLLHDLNWQDISPILVVEVVYDSDRKKDLERNVELYLQVPSIREYWIVDSLADADHPTLIVYRRRGRLWQKPILVNPGETYTTRLLPDFELPLPAPRS